MPCFNNIQKVQVVTELTNAPTGGEKMVDLIKLLMVATFIFLILNNVNADNSATEEDIYNSNSTAIDQYYDNPS